MTNVHRAASAAHGWDVFVCIANKGSKAHLVCREYKRRFLEKVTKMSIHKTARGFFGNAISILGAATAVAAAVEGHRRPKDRDLLSLGIDPANFRMMRRG